MSLFTEVRIPKRGSNRNPLPNPSRRTIVVVNPGPHGPTEAGPLSQARKSLTSHKESNTMATAKQIAARKRFAAMARSGAFKRKRKKSTKARNPRPRVSVKGSPKKGYTFSLGKRSKYKGRVKAINPSRRRRRSFKRRNPSSRGGKKLFGFVDTNLLMSFALGGAGFVATVKFINPQLARLQVMAPQADGTASWANRLKGLAYIAASLFAIAKVKNRVVRDLAIGVGVAGAYDVIAQNIPQAGLASLNGMDYSLVGYDPMMGSDVSPYDLANLNGADVSFMGQDVVLAADASAIGVQY